MHCPHFEAERCKSCSEIRTPYATQLRDKQQVAARALAPFGRVQWLEPVASAEFGFRNKAKMVVQGSSSAPILGIVDPAGSPLDLSDCQLYPPAFICAFGAIRAFIIQAALEPYQLDTRRGELKYLLLTEAPSGELMLRLVLRSRASEARIRKWLPKLCADLPLLKLVSLNIQPEHKAILEGDHEIILSAATALTMDVNGIPLRLGPQAFFQTNSALAAQLYAQAAAWVDEIDPNTLFDLYCGVGGFALSCAKPGRHVVGVELSASAIAAARAAAAQLALEPWVRFVAMDSGRFSESLPACVIVNPPRRGLDESLCAALNGAQTEHLIYSSCNIESLARDLARMPAYELKRARLFDLFPHTRHFEALTLLQRRPDQGGQ